MTIRRKLLPLVVANILAGTAHAATITVNTNVDARPITDGFCSLREAVINANNDDQSGSSDCVAGFGTDVINLGSVVGDIQLDQGEIVISESLRINGGLMSTVISGRGGSRIFFVDDSGAGTLNPPTEDVSFTNVTLTDGNGVGEFNSGSGGAIFSTENLTITGSTVTANSGVSAIVIAMGSLELSDSSVSANAGNGVGINTQAYATVDRSTIDANDGKGLVIVNSSGSRITQSTISNNNLIELSSYGGGIRIYGGTGSHVITNSTISGNAAGTDGSALEVDGTSAVVRFSTITANSDPSGQIFAYGVAASVTLDHTIVSNPVGAGTNCASAAGMIFLENPNLITDTSCGAGTITLDPNLGALADNGGNTLTHALIAPSPAIDQADPADCTAIAGSADQVGSDRRPSDGDDDTFSICDLGAFEVQGPEIDDVVFANGFEME